MMEGVYKRDKKRERERQGGREGGREGGERERVHVNNEAMFLIPSLRGSQGQD